MRVAHCVRKEERQFVDAILNVMHSAPFMYIVLVLWAISAIGLIIFVLMHSGKGTGVSEVIAGSIYGTDGIQYRRAQSRSDYGHIRGRVHGILASPDDFLSHGIGSLVIRAI